MSVRTNTEGHDLCRRHQGHAVLVAAGITFAKPAPVSGHASVSLGSGSLKNEETKKSS
jgi:hypothetical protein